MQARRSRRQLWTSFAVKLRGAVLHALADGPTLLVITPANTIDVSFYDKLEFDFERDIKPIASLIRSPFVLEIFPGFPAKTVPELIAYAKSNPGKVNWRRSAPAPPVIFPERYSR